MHDLVVDWRVILLGVRKSTDRQSPPSSPRFVPTGINGLDEVLQGGYPEGRPTLVRGVSGAGKTILSLLFALGPRERQSPAVYGTFDESPEHLREYVRALGRDDNVTFLDFRPDPDTQIAGGMVELGGVLVRIEHALKTTGAKRLVLDAFDMLFESFDDKAQIRRDLFRVFEWCRQHDVTLVATTGEQTDYRASTGLMDYASDSTILLSQRMDNGLMTRVLRILKSRGRAHGTNEYPYLIDARGISVMPVTETRMSGKSSRKRVSTGIDRLDDMLGGRGFWQGSTVMISGHSGTGKSLIALSMAATACERGETVIYFSFEESPEQIVRDVRSVGLRLKAHLDSGNLVIRSQRPVERGLEEHVIRLIRSIDDLKPDLVVIDPISSLADMGDARAFKNTVLRLGQYLKTAGITTVLTELLPDDSRETSTLNISSLVDTWIRLRRIERDGELGREIYVHKSRGSRTSNEVKIFRITNRGLLIDERPKRQA